MNKECSKCGVSYPRTPEFFRRRKDRKDGLNDVCKVCHAAYNREWKVKNREKIIESRRRYESSDKGKASGNRTRMRHYHKHQARTAVWYALKVGKISKQPCEVCGVDEVEAHHKDYSNPLDVEWLCMKHHRLLYHPTQYRDQGLDTKDNL